MNKYIFIYIMFNSFIHILNGQSFQVSEKIDLKNSIAYDYFKVDNNFILLLSMKDDINMYKLDSDLNYLSSNFLLHSINRPHVIGVCNSIDRFTIFFRHKINKEYLISANIYNSDCLLIESTIIFKSTDFFNISDFIISSDNSKCSFYYTDYIGNTKLFVFDILLNQLLYSKYISLDMQEAKQLLLSNIGDIFILDKQRKRLFNSNDYKINISKVNKFSIESYIIDYNHEYDIGSSQLFQGNEDKNVIYAGFLGHDSNKVNASFILVIPSDDTRLLRLSPFYFTNEVFKNFYKQNETKYDYIEDLNIKDVIFRRDKGFMIISEVSRKLLRRNINSRLDNSIISKNWTEFYDHEILLLNFSNLKTLSWTRSLLKYQYTQDNSVVFSSFGMLKNEDKVCFLFNDINKNQSTITQYTVNAMGEIKRKTLLNLESSNYRLRFRDALQSDYFSLIVPSQYNNNLELVNIIY